ncbi:MAG: DEAD/DEAH box helicase [Candidatus Heimdallarchaeota archaeon]
MGGEFEILSNPLKTILAEMGFTEPTPIQQKAMPEILEGSDSLLISATGSGKTEAVILPLFEKLLKIRHEQGRIPRIAILYITPLRALNRDVYRRILPQLGENLGIRVEVRHGDTTPYQRAKQAKDPPHVLITTPETLQAILPAKRMGKHLRHVFAVVLDELHELVDNKRGVQLSIALERLRERTGTEFQRIGLSATVGNPEIVADFLNPGKPTKILEIVDIKKTKLKVILPQPQVEREYSSRDEDELTPEVRATLEMIIKVVNDSNGSILLFTNTRAHAETLASRLQTLKAGITHSIHHGSLSKDVRVEAEEAFREGTLDLIVATSSLELGIDIGYCEKVIQVMSPRQVVRLLQRVGRSGHSIEGVSEGIIISPDPVDALEAMVIAQRALRNELEPTRLYKKAYDVLAHQIIGILLDHGKMSFQDIYQIVRRAAPFRDLSSNELFAVIELLQELKYIWKEGNNKDIASITLGLRRGSHSYYFGTLSTIPSQRKFKVENIRDRQPIGTLDATFVATHATPGEIFVMRGHAWKVLRLEHEKQTVVVESLSNPLAAPPSWIGELIPVPFEVTQEVGQLRAELARPNTPGTVPSLHTYPVSKETVQIVEESIKEHSERAVIPTDETLLIEATDTLVMIHACFGNRTNETLAQLMGALLTARLGESVAVKATAYALIIQPPRRLSASFIKSVLEEITPEYVEPLLKKALRFTDLYNWRFLHVTTRFGVIKEPFVSYNIPIRKLARIFAGTLIEEEVFNEIFFEKFNIPQAIQVLNSLQNKKRHIQTLESGHIKSMSPLSQAILLDYSGGSVEIVRPDQPRRVILEIVEKRLLNSKARLICFWCGQYEAVRTIKTLEDHPKCPFCGSRYLAAVHIGARDLRRLFNARKHKREIEDEQNRKLDRAFQSAELVITHGKRAIIALAGVGIGPKTAARVLRSVYSEWPDFIRAILEAERKFAETRDFW